MDFIKKNWKGMLACLCIAVPSWLLGKKFPIIGGPVIAIIAGMVITLMIKDKSALESGIKYTSKKILQYAVVLLGFGLNLEVIFKTGRQSLPIIISTITTSLVIAYVLHRVMHIPGKISTLVGVGSSICGGSAIAATAPVIDADDEEVAQAISVIFFFNVLAAILFPVSYTHLNVPAQGEETLFAKQRIGFYFLNRLGIFRADQAGAQPVVWRQRFNLRRCDKVAQFGEIQYRFCLLYTSPDPG